MFSFWGKFVKGVAVFQKNSIGDPNCSAMTCTYRVACFASRNMQYQKERKTGVEVKKETEKQPNLEDKQTINQSDGKQLLPLSPIKEKLQPSDKTVTHIGDGEILHSVSWKNLEKEHARLL